jgi:hypothetical protein
VAVSRAAKADRTKIANARWPELAPGKCDQPAPASAGASFLHAWAVIAVSGNTGNLNDASVWSAARELTGLGMVLVRARSRNRSGDHAT